MAYLSDVVRQCHSKETGVYIFQKHFMDIKCAVMKVTLRSFQIQ